MADVVRTTREPMLGPIRLAWWRERLEELDGAAGAPAEPRLLQVERELLPRGVSGHDVAGLEPGWLRLFDPFPWGSETGEAVWLRGNLLFGLGARLLGERSEPLQAAGGLWALVDVARHCSDGASREMLLKQARGFATKLGGALTGSSGSNAPSTSASGLRSSRRSEWHSRTKPSIRKSTTKKLRAT